MMAPWIIFCYSFALFLILNRYSTTAQMPPIYYPTANLSTTWTNTNDSMYIAPLYDSGSRIRPILLREASEDFSFACGFHCNGDCLSYIFAVFIVQTNNTGGLDDFEFNDPQVVWSANRDHPVSNGATLDFTEIGDLILEDVDGTTVWTINTIGKSVVGMNLTHTGNLVLFDVNGYLVWQSFDYPTNCLMLGQNLSLGQQLVPSVSSTNWTAQKGLFSLQVTDKGLVASVGSNPPQLYYRTAGDKQRGSKYLSYSNGSLDFFTYSIIDSIIIPKALSPVQYTKFMPDGHLKVFDLKDGEWSEVYDVLTYDYPWYGKCIPFACGRNAICSNNQECSCPASNPPTIDYFRPVNDRQPSLGCSAITPLTCNSTQDQHFITLQNVSYSGDSPADIENVSMETCKQACLTNCSCKAAVFKHNSDHSYGRCSLPYDLLALAKIDPDMADYNASTFIKVQSVRSSPSRTSPIPKKKAQPSIQKKIITSILGSFLVLLVVVGFITFLNRKKRSNAQMEEEYIDAVPGMPTRFTYDELKTATDNFTKKLGQGGFGSVFEGTFEDDSKIAVKRLDGLGQVNKSFLAEVESIGSIHHVNLVRLIGFCAWKSQRFLVYDFMSNGSLDRWIYHGIRERVLGWECRKKIILDIAKGLAYLHEECRQKIIHLDIKPQNILLDHDFNAKVSDFGLSKLIDRDQSQVMTTMRGTPGYMAPEWLSSSITEKVDVYSFGIVLLEILCGRKNFDKSQPEETWHLLGVFKKCWQQGTLLDIVDKYSEDMQTHGSEVMEMIKVASWCLQTDFTRRPSMSSVVTVLEGRMNVESNLDCNFTDFRLQNTAVQRNMTPLLASVLSGPR